MQGIARSLIYTPDKLIIVKVIQKFIHSNQYLCISLSITKNVMTWTSTIIFVKEVKEQHIQNIISSLPDKFRKITLSRNVSVSNNIQEQTLGVVNDKNILTFFGMRSASGCLIGDLKEYFYYKMLEYGYDIEEIRLD